MASGMVVDVTTLPDPLFAESLMGETIAFSYTEDKITLCAPANGKLSVLFSYRSCFWTCHEQWGGTTSSLWY